MPPRDGHRYTLLLVNPAVKSGRGFIVNKDTRYQPLSLGIIASLTPSDWKVKIIDENYRNFRFYEADLVGFTAFSSTVSRAYEIAKIYREKGIPTVIGGIHASMCPDEAVRFVDSVVIGEAESAWPQVISDFLQGRLQKVYHGNLTDMINSPKPRRDLFFPGYVFASIQTTRGCPFNCDFCSVTAFNGSHYRYRPIPEVIAEMKEIPQKYVFILDDNIVGNTVEAKERAKELFRALIRSKIRKKWIGQASLNVADDEEVLKLAAQSGCRMLFIGLESEREDQLQEVHKRLNIRMGVRSYNQVFKKLHKQGIAVIAGFMFGWDNETTETIKARVKFIRRCHADSIQVTFLTPLPGTVLFKRMQEANRIVLNKYPADWQYYGYEEVVFQPLLMGREEMRNMVYHQVRRIFNTRFLMIRSFKTLLRTGSVETAIWSYRSNWNYRNMTFGRRK